MDEFWKHHLLSAMNSIPQHRLKLMMLGLGFAVSGMSKFGGFKPAKLSLFPVNPDSGNPFPLCLAPRHSNKPGLVAFLRCAGEVLHIFMLICLSQIAKFVVARVPVNVVDVLFRPTAMNIKPSQTVSIEPVLKNADGHPVVQGRGSCDISNLGFPAMTGRFEPSKDSGVWVVMQTLAHKFWSKIRFNHDAPFQRIGQRLTCVDSTGGLRYFSTSSNVPVTF